MKTTEVEATEDGINITPRKGQDLNKISIMWKRGKKYKKLKIILSEIKMIKEKVEY